MNDQKLLPCPFCGGEAIVEDVRWVKCSNEKCILGGRWAIQHNIDKWNTRHSGPKPADMDNSIAEHYGDVNKPAEPKQYDCNHPEKDTRGCPFPFDECYTCQYHIELSKPAEPKADAPEQSDEAFSDEMLANYWFDTEYSKIPTSDHDACTKSRLQFRKWIDENKPNPPKK